MSEQRNHLVRLLQSGASAGEVRSFVLGHPNSLGGGSHYPILHQFIMDHWVDEASALLTAYPEALGMAGHYKNKVYPIHYLAEAAMSLYGVPGPDDFDDEDEDEEREVYNKFTPFVNLFFETDPEVFSQQDAQGNTAFHWFACEYDGFNLTFTLPAEELKRLINLNSSALQIANSEGNLPLHTAASMGNGASEDRLEALIEGYPESVKIPNSNGEYPLHLAATTRVNSAPFKLILRKYPDAASKADKRGCFPLHIAWNTKHVDNQEVALLIEAFPQALLVKNPLDGSFPIDSAEKSRYTQPELIVRMKELWSAAQEKW